MNPYLEHPHVWHDFHQQFCIDCRTALLSAIAPKYYCRLDENIYLHDLSDEPDLSLVQADVAIIETATANVPSTDSTAHIAAPIHGRIVTQTDVEREVFLEIRDRETSELITVIELLSPANKRRGRDREQFLKKRSELLNSDVNYVEIDLLRGGPRLPVEGLPRCDYYALTSRAESRPDVDLWPVVLRDPLPVIAIPLRSPDSDVPLDLQAVLRESFERGGYQMFVYDFPVKPPLSTEDQVWANELIKNSTTAR